MKKLVVLMLIAVATVVAVGAGAAQADGPKPILVTFQKHVVDPTNFVFSGTTGGRVKGDLTSRLVPGSLTQGPRYWTMSFDWIVSAKANKKSFVARTTGVFDTVTGTVIMDGSVTDGWHLGAPVHEKGQLIDPTTFTFTGVIAIDVNDGEDNG